jgi:hypothetical protein
MNKVLSFALVFIMVFTVFTSTALAADSGSIPIGLKLFGFTAAEFIENGEGEYVGTLELKGYRIGYKYNIKQAGISNAAGHVRYLEFTEFAEAPAWSTYYTSTQKVAIKQTHEEQTVDFIYKGPAALGVKTTVTVTVPALPVEAEVMTAPLRALAAEAPQGEPLITGFAVGGLTAPAAGEAPVTLSGLSNNGDGRYEVTGLRWYPEVAGTFAANTTYYALVTVEANEGCLFDGNYGALELMTGGRLKNIDVGFDGVINLNEMYDFDQVPLVKKFTFQVTCPATQP